MSDSDQPDSQGALSPREVSQWAEQEVTNSAKAFELRKKEATELATQYAAGEISPEEANRRLVAYDRRWGEAIYGVSAAENLSDKQILDQIDQARSDTKRAFTAAITSRDIPRSGR